MKCKDNYKCNSIQDRQTIMKMVMLCMMNMIKEILLLLKDPNQEEQEDLWITEYQILLHLTIVNL
jgi:hypothetical protein